MSWLLCLYNIFPSICVSVCWEGGRNTSSLSGTTKLSRLILYSSWPKPRISHFSKVSKVSWFLLLENGIRNQIWALEVSDDLCYILTLDLIFHFHLLIHNSSVSSVEEFDASPLTANILLSLNFHTKLQLSTVDKNNLYQILHTTEKHFPKTILLVIKLGKKCCHVVLLSLLIKLSSMDRTR